MAGKKKPRLDRISKLAVDNGNSGLKKVALLPIGRREAMIEREGCH